eukprot:156476-Chlamydomonas_euryale.AAC.1
MYGRVPRMGVCHALACASHGHVQLMSTLSPWECAMHGHVPRMGAWAHVPKCQMCVLICAPATMSAILASPEPHTPASVAPHSCAGRARGDRPARLTGTLGPHA